MSSRFSRPKRASHHSGQAAQEGARRRRHAVAAAIMAVGCAIGLAAPAMASPLSPNHPITGAYKWIYNFHSGKCISITNASSANGVKLHQDPCANTQSFGWLPVQGFSGEEYFFRNETSAKCMSIQNVRSGSAIVQEPCNYQNPPANERFVFIYEGQSQNYGWYLIQSVRSALCLRLNEASKRNGAGLVQHYCDTPQGQEYFILASAGTHLPCPCTLGSSERASNAGQRPITPRGRVA
jgi:Ricin-type beta-trefoil lectin domain